MTEEKVYSPIKDENIKKCINCSPIWKECYTKDELTEDVRKKKLYCYTIKFNGLTPAQVTNIKEY